MISIANIPTCFCEDDKQYTNCNDNAFDCGNNVTNLKYPFWGGNRAQYCRVSADPNTELTCEENVPKITINNVKYRIFEWENTKQKFTVARDDYWSGICAVSVSDSHTNSTFDNTQFQRYGDVSSKITLLYNCDTNLPSMFYSATCGNTKVVYTFVDPGSVLLSCTPTVIVEIPIMETQAARIATPTLNDINQALQDGFELKWTGNYGECQRCVDSGGVCGNDEKSGFKCFCKDGHYTTTCDSQNFPSSSMYIISLSHTPIYVSFYNYCKL